MREFIVSLIVKESRLQAAPTQNDDSRPGCGLMGGLRRGALVGMVAGLVLLWASPCLSSDYPWLQSYDPGQALSRRIPPPARYERVAVPRGSFQEWLRNLPLKPGNPPVHLHDGRPKANQEAHVAVVDIDVGKLDLQQCADAVIRLRAEFLYARQQLDGIHFNFTNGEAAFFSRWIEGFRPSIKGNRVAWRKTAGNDRSHASLMAYLGTVFSYAGTASLAQELQPVEDIHDMQIGDVLIQGGFPGHAVIVVDMAEDRESGKKAFALAQSYMPAQDIHLLRNPARSPATAWYDLEFGETLTTPEWTFRKSHLRRFR